MSQSSRWVKIDIISSISLKSGSLFSFYSVIILTKCSFIHSRQCLLVTHTKHAGGPWFTWRISLSILLLGHGICPGLVYTCVLCLVPVDHRDLGRKAMNRLIIKLREKKRGGKQTSISMRVIHSTEWNFLQITPKNCLIGVTWIILTVGRLAY